MTLDPKKWIGLAVALALVAFFIYRQSQPPLASASVKLRVQTRFSSSGEPLLLSQSKAFTQNSVMMELLRRLQRETASAPENQKKILALRDKMKVTRQGNTEIFLLEVFDPNPQEAKQIAFQWAQAIQALDQGEERRNSGSQLQTLNREADLAKQKIEDAEIFFRKVQRDNTPTDIDRRLVQLLQEEEAKYQRLAVTYKETHPDMVETARKIASLKEQIMDGPAINPEAVRQAEQALQQAIQHHQDLVQKIQDAGLEAHAVTGNIQIIEFFSSTSPGGKNQETLQPLHYAAIAVALALSITLRAYFRRKF